MKKLPPKNLDVEQSLLGALLLDKEAILDAAEILGPDNWYDYKHRVIYESILALLDEGLSIDLMTISDHLRKRELLEKVGGVEYLSELTNSVPTAAHAKEYAEIVKGLSVRRKMISAAAKIEELAFQEDRELSMVLDEAEQNLFSISQERVTDRPKHIKKLLEKAYERAESVDKENTSLGIKTGLKRLDSIISGFQDSDLVILAARPSVGKTACALDFARHAAIKEEKTVLIFSLEMSEMQLMDRLVATQAGVSLWDLRTGKLSDEDFKKLGTAFGQLAEADIFIHDKPGQSIMEMRAKARRLHSEVGVDLIIMDYLQLAKSRGLENRVQEISEVSMGLKNLAREVDVPLIALSQLSRSVENRVDKRPRLSDLRDSGSIEQDADIVMFIHREELYDPDTEKKGIADLIIAKHRNGPVGDAEVAFVKELASFRNLHSRQKK
jgi:replicative DNA helicase